MDTMSWIGLIALILILALSILLLTGRGSFLIAGYNTASKEEKAKYQEKRLCRVVGAGVGVETLLVSVFLLPTGNLPAFLNWLIPVLIILVLGITLLLGNTVCKK